MSQRIRELLDEAVAGIEPRHADPVAAVIRRGRTARARAVAAGGLAVVTVLTGGTVAGTRLLDDPPQEIGEAPAPATRPDRPPAPRLQKGRIVAGSVSVAVPRGWEVIGPGSGPTDLASASPGSEDLSCDLRRRTVLIGEGGNPDGPPIWCTTADVEVQSVYDVRPYVWVPPGEGAAADEPWVTSPVIAPRMITLAGGEAAWVRYDADTAYRVTLPWSRVEVRIRAGEDVRDQVLDSLRTGRWAPAALALPRTAGYATLTVAVDAVRARERELTDEAKVRRALELLRQAPMVAEGDSCAREDQPTVALEIGMPPDAVAPPDHDFVKNPRLSSLVISLAEGCHEVVAEEGGRARLDAASLAELGDLFGVQLP